MLRAEKLIRKADLAGRITVDSITLARADRYKRRVAMTTDRGHAFLLDLADATYMADGDALDLGVRGLVVVRAAPEDLLEVHAHDAAALARIAWHIGNRHTPAEVTAHAIYIQPDHVLAEMVSGLGGHVHLVKRPFEPEGGAYGGKGPLNSGHHHGADEGAAHGGHHHDHPHDPSHDHGHPHRHEGVGVRPPKKPAVWRPD